MSHRCPDEATCAFREPCCLYQEGDCLCDWPDMCRQTEWWATSAPTRPIVDLELPAPRTLRVQPRRTTRAQRRGCR